MPVVRLCIWRSGSNPISTKRLGAGGYLFLALAVAWLGAGAFWLAALVVSDWAPSCTPFAPTNVGICRLGDELAAITLYWGWFLMFASIPWLVIVAILMAAKSRRERAA